MNEIPLERLVIRRWYQAPRDLVYRAFIEPAFIERWLHPKEGITVRVAHWDLRVGGRYRLEYRLENGRTVPVLGDFHEIAPPRKLVFAWTWEKPDLHAGVKTLVTIELLEKDGGTEVVLTHDRLPSREKRQAHESGWGRALDVLAQRIHSQAEDGFSGDSGPPSQPGTERRDSI